MRLRNYIKGFIALLLFSFPILGEVKFTVSKEEILLGEPLYAQFEVDGNPEVSMMKNIYSENGVVAEFIKIEQVISSINFNVTRKKIVKFRIIASKPGKHKVPRLEINVSGSIVPSPETYFKVKSEKFQPPRQPQSLFDRIFSDHFSERAYIEPDSDDILIHFVVNRDNVYVGESIVGFYKVLFKDMSRPSIERNQLHNLEFKYFTTEQLTDVSVSVDNQETLNGSTYEVFPYDKEIFSLTPLKPGNYTLGDVQFDVEGSLESYFSARAILSKPSKVSVRELPSPKPNNFTGEVGSYNFTTYLPVAQVPENQSTELLLKIHGEGTTNLFKDPLDSYCKASNKCSFQYVLLEKNVNKKFSKLKNGGYGFVSEAKFKYGIVFNKQGNYKPFPIEICFFNPSSGTYEVRSAEIPAIHVTPPAKTDDEDIYQSSGKSFSWGGLFWSGFFAFIGYMAYRYKQYLPRLAMGLMHFFNIRFYPEDPESIINLDRIVGIKKGTLLKNFLLDKGINKQKIVELLVLKRKSNYASLADIYKNADKNQKEYLLKLTDDILKENKL